MIAHLKGKIEAIDGANVVVDVNGVGYGTLCSSRVTKNYAIGDNIKLHTELIIKEIGWFLFGFVTNEEKEWFDILTSVQGVGGKVALAILSALNDEDLQSCLINDDKRTLCLADGVGDRLAGRIISELKPKMKKIMGMTFKDSSGLAGNVATGSSIKSDVISAIVNLGYNRNDVVQILMNESVDTNGSFDEVFRTVLNLLATK